VTIRALPVLLAALAAGALGFYLGQPRETPTPGGQALALGAEVPALRFADFEGRERLLSEWRGRFLVLNFWASWCAPCIKELPILAQFGKEFPEVTVLAIALDEPEPALALLRKLGLGDGLVPLLAAHGDPSPLLGNGRGLIPFTVAIDGGLRLRERHFGLIDRERLERWRAAHGPPARGG
jgi:thiol-disulfide isomerase/thioredoxin